MDWVQYIRQDEDAALRELYRMHRDDCVQFLIVKYGLSHVDAKEIFQLSIVTLYDNVISGKLITLSSQIKTYIYGIAKNKAMEAQRRGQRVSYVAYGSEMDEGVSLDHGANTEANNNYADLNKALEVLGDPCKAIIESYYYKQWNMEEISTNLGYKNADTAKNLKYKCLKRLQSIMEVHKEKENKI